MAENTARMKLMIDADTRNLSKMEKEFKKATKVLSQSEDRGFFSKRQAKKLSQNMMEMRTGLVGIEVQHRNVTKEINKLEWAHQKIINSGKKISFAQKKEMQFLREKKRLLGHEQRGLRGQISGLEQRAGKMDVGLGRHAWSRIKKGAPRAVMSLPSLAMRAGGWVKGQMDAGLQTAVQTDMAQMQAEGVSGRRGGFLNLRNKGIGYGMTSAESLNLLSQTARATGRTSNKGAIANMQMSKGYGMDAGAITGYQAQLRHAGGMASNASIQAINEALVKGVKIGGFKRALTGEFVQAATGLISATADNQERTRQGMISGLIGSMGRRLGGGFAQSPQRTSKLLQGLSGTIQAPGGGEAGQGFMLRAMGMGKGKSYVQALEAMEKGITDPGNLKRVLSQVKSEYGGEDNQALALSRLSGGKVKIWQARRLLKMNTDNLTEAGIQGELAGGSANIKGEAGKRRRLAGLSAKAISVQEKQAQARRKGDALYTKAQELQIKAMNLAIKFLDKALPVIEGIEKNGLVRTVLKPVGQAVLHTSKKQVKQFKAVGRSHGLNSGMLGGEDWGDE